MHRLSPRSTSICSRGHHGRKRPFPRILWNPRAGSILTPVLAGTIPFITVLDRENRKPRFPSDRPKLVGRSETVSGVEGTEIDLHFVAAAPEHGRAAGRAEVPVAVVPRFPGDADLADRIDRRGMKKRAVMLAAVQAMAKPDAVRLTAGLDPHAAAEAATGDNCHVDSLSKFTGCLA